MSQKIAFPVPLLKLLCLGGLMVSSTTAWAGPSDAEAKKLAEQAIYEDYLNLQFDAAIEKLKQAATLCETGCGQSIKAMVLRDLGVVYFAGMEDPATAQDYFKQAIQADPFIRLDEDLSSDEIKAAFDEAKAAVGAPTSADLGGTTPEPAAAVEPESAVSGEHEPPKEQAVDTPVPIFLRTSGEGVDGVKLMFRAPGQDKFRSMGLRPYKGGWGGEIDCGAVSKQPGTLEYYFVLYDEMGREFERVGDEFDTFSVPIKQTISGRGPSLPDQSPPSSCRELSAADCPPGFPGCESYEGEEWAQQEEEAVDVPSFWFTLGGQLDFLMMEATGGACFADSGYACFYSDGTYRDPNAPLINRDGNVVFDPVTNEAVPSNAGVSIGGQQQGAGTLPSGFALGTQRIMLGVDYAATPEILVGVRLGYALGGAPQKRSPFSGDGQAFVPIHAEVRGAYWFTGAHRGTVRPYAQLGAGLAQVDAGATVHIVDTQFIQTCFDLGQTTSNCLERKLTAYRVTGTAFASAGLGMMLAVGDNHGFMLEGRGMLMFPVSGTALAAGLGYTFGL